MRKIVFFFALFIFCQNVFSQSCPANIDFEKGDFTNWDCFIGGTSVINGNQNSIVLNPSAPVTGRHEIISATSPVKKDPFGNFPTLCPYGGNYSVKLGNSDTRAEAEGLSYTFQVPALVDTFTFTYFYAVVFEDPGHAVYEQPRFFVTAYDVLTGNLINCASYNYVATGSIPGFQRSTVQPDVLYKNWSPVSIQFAGLANRMVRLEFKTADCTLGGHFGYAYIDVAAGCSNILATAPYCIETNSIILNAPYGFQNYTWYSDNFKTIIGNQQTLTLSPPPVKSGTFHVDMVPYPGFGCRDTLDAVVVPLPIPDTPVAKSVSYCQFATASPLVADVLPYHDLIWYTAGLGGIGTDKPPTPPTNVVGTFYYFVSQKKLFGCESFRKMITVNITKTPVVSFTINNSRQCEDKNLFITTNTSTNLSNSNYAWSFGDGSAVASDSVANGSHSYLKYGNFNITLKVQNDSACTVSKTLAINVIPKPLASFVYPPIICEKQTSVVLTDASSVPSNLSQITKWWWNINGTITIAQTPNPFVAITPGQLPVRLMVGTAEGCWSDTLSTILFTHNRPTALFKYNSPLCDNETAMFTDLSTMPTAAAPDYITKWYWQFDNAVSTSVTNPALSLLAGLRLAKLTVETNYGCKSVEKDSTVTVNAKPQTQFIVSDSCIFRTIKYNAVDVLNTVDRWYWDFGNGLHQGPALMTKTFYEEGNNSFTLIGQTTYGCKDTIIRPFTIFDNKAFAGRDTLVAKDQPVQLNANGGSSISYVWTPATGMNDATLEKPIANWDSDILYYLDAISDKGCDAHSKILIKRFKGPELYIPTGFTPNGDNTNEVLKVFPVGIKTFGSFAVYNRYGQELFRTTDFTKGWDGTFNGQKSDAGNYVAIALAVDYRGNAMKQSVNVLLIR